MTEIEVVNPLHELYSVLNDIATSITDINYQRANLTNSKSRQWWFPDTPEKNDENYPRGCITFGTITVREYGGGQYVQYTGTTDQYGQYITIPVTMSVFVKKDQKHYTIYPDGSKHPLQNKKLSDEMIYKLYNIIRVSRHKLINKGFDIEGDINITPSYDDNHFLFAADITFDVVILSVWNIKYGMDEIIKTITHQISVLNKNGEYDI
jgi:hypothetical protein